MSIYIEWASFCNETYFFVLFVLVKNEQAQNKSDLIFYFMFSILPSSKCSKISNYIFKAPLIIPPAKTKF